VGIYTYVFNLNYLLFITCTDKVLRDNNNIFTAIGFLPGGSGYFICKQNMRLVTTRFKSGGLHEKHVVATWNIGNRLSSILRASDEVKFEILAGDVPEYSIFQGPEAA